MQLSKKQNTLLQCFSAFLKSRSNFEHFEKKMTPIVYLFLKLRTAKDIVR